MRTLLVVDHPYSGAFTRALADAARRGFERAGHEVDLVDLHADGFDPVMRLDDLAAWREGRAVDPLAVDYQRRLAEADHLVLAFPVWWEVMPAMTKGFVDKVITKGFAYDQPVPGGRMRRRLTGLGGVTVLTSMATPAAAYRLVFGNPLTKALFRGTFLKIGVRNLTWLSHSNPAGHSPEQRQAMLDRVESRCAARGARQTRRVAGRSEQVRAGVDG